MFVTPQPAPPRNASPRNFAANIVSTQQKKSITRSPSLQLWERIVARLPTKSPEEWYSLKEIAPLLGLKPRSLAKHARDLWPRWEGHYRLDHARAVSLIRRVCYAGKKVPID